MRSILLIDDEEANRRLIHRRLRNDGFHVVTAEGGAQALELMADQRFDLVLLDLFMPLMDGLETLDSIKSDVRHDGIPVMMLTAAKDREKVVHCLSLGAADYLIKPVSLLDLRSRVRRCLRMDD